MQFRTMMAPLESILGKSVADGKRLSLDSNSMQVYMQKYSKQSQYKSDFSFVSQD